LISTPVHAFKSASKDCQTAKKYFQLFVIINLSIITVSTIPAIFKVTCCKILGGSGAVIKLWGEANAVIARKYEIVRFGTCAVLGFGYYL
jgi:hypothetical protein